MAPEGKDGLFDTGHGAQIEYRRLGPDDSERPPLLLMRPLLGELGLWGDFARALATDRPLVLFNPRGVGRSTGPLFALTTQELALDALELADGLGLVSFDVLGSSLGGMVATHLAAQAPNRVRRLVLTSTLPRGGAVSFDALLELGPSSGDLFTPLAQTETHVLGRLLSRRFWLRAPARALTALRRLRGRPTRLPSVMALGVAAFRHDATAELARLRCPTLLVYGADDALVRPEARAEFSAALPNAQVVVLPGTGHDISIERPDELARLVRAFLDVDAVGKPENRPNPPLESYRARATGAI